MKIRNRRFATQPQLQSTTQQRQHVGIERTSPSGTVTRVKGQVTLDFASCAAAAVTNITATIPGALASDAILLVPPAAGLSVAVAIGQCYVSAANTVKVPVINPTAGALDPASAVFEYVIFRQTPNTP